MYGRPAERAHGEGGGAGVARAEVGAGHEDGCHGAVQADPAHEGFSGLLQAGLQSRLLGFQFGEACGGRVH